MLSLEKFLVPPAGALLILLACSGTESAGNEQSAPGGATGGDGASVEPGPDTLQGFCQALSQEICQLAAPCCTTQQLDVAQCTETRTVSCESEYGRGAYDALLAGQCLRAYETLADCLYGQDELAPCGELATARSPLGGPCQSALDCLQGSVEGATCVNSVCVAVPYLNQGDNCSDSSIARCRPPLSCIESVQLPRVEPTCQQLLPLGASCQLGQCASAYCDTQTHTCIEIPVADAFCATRGT